MTEIHITEYLKTSTQAQLAKLLDCTQGNISQIVKAERDVILVFRGKKFVRFYEITKPRKSKNRAA